MESFCLWGCKSKIVKDLVLNVFLTKWFPNRKLLFLFFRTFYVDEQYEQNDEYVFNAV